MKQRIQLKESQLKAMIAEAVRKTLNEDKIPSYDNPVFINCSSEMDADMRVELGYSDYSSSLFFVGECGTDTYAALEEVVNYLTQNDIIDAYTADTEMVSEEDCVEVNGYYLPSWLIHIEQLCDNHGGRRQDRISLSESRLRAIIKEAVRKSLNEISTDTAIAAHKKAQADLDNMDFRWDDMDARDKYDKRQRQADKFAEYAQENGAAYYPYGVIGWYNDTNEDDLYDRSEVVYGDSIEDVPNEGDGIYALTRDGKETYEQWKEDASAGYDLCYGRMKGLARSIGGKESDIWRYLTSNTSLSKQIK